MNAVYTKTRSGELIELMRPNAGDLLANGQLVGSIRRDADDVVLCIDNQPQRIRYSDYLRVLATPANDAP
jgi:hypothetical protein